MPEHINRLRGAPEEHYAYMRKLPDISVLDPNGIVCTMHSISHCLRSLKTN
jgi:hypothetical protein